MDSKITLDRLVGVLELKFKHGTKSYEIVNRLLRAAFPARSDLVVIDLTYGLGRFYRIARRRIGLLIGVDIAAYEWEVKPDIFILDNATNVVNKILKGQLQLPRPDLVVVDPPWSAEKRGIQPHRVGFSNMPYHFIHVSSKALIYAALRLAAHYQNPLLYKYKEQLQCSHVVKARHTVTIMKKQGTIYYGVCSPNGGELDKNRTYTHRDTGEKP